MSLSAVVHLLTWRVNSCDESQKPFWGPVCRTRGRRLCELWKSLLGAYLNLSLRFNFLGKVFEGMSGCNFERVYLGQHRELIGMGG
jgi:hypothetical protein